MMDEELIQMLQKRLDSIDRHLERLNGRTGKLENWRAFLTGGFVVLVGVVGYLLKM